MGRRSHRDRRPSRARVIGRTLPCMGVLIRPAALTDLRDLRALRLDALGDSPEAFGSTLQREAHADDSSWRGWILGEGWDGAVTTFVADAGHQLVGMATGYHPDDDPDIVHLFAMWVRPDRRHQGIGRQLVAAVVDWAADRPGVDRVLLRVTTTNESAARFYAVCGFEAIPDPPEPLREGSALSTTTMWRGLASDVDPST